MDDLRQAAALPPQLDRALRDSRDVEQIVDEPHQVRDLTVDDRVRFRRLAVERRELTQHFDAVADRRKRIAQFVRERLEELVSLQIGGREPRRGPGRSTRCGPRPISSSHSRFAADSADSPSSILPAGTSHSSRSSAARYCLISTTRPSLSIGITTTAGGWRTTSIWCSWPFGKRRFSTSTENTRPLKTTGIRLRCRATLSGWPRVRPEGRTYT